MSPRESFTCVARTHECRTVSTDLITHFVAEDKYVTGYYPGGDVLLSDTIASLQEEFSGIMVRSHRKMLVRKDSIRAIKIRTGTSVFDMAVEGVQVPLQVSRAGRRTVLSARPDLRGGAA